MSLRLPLTISYVLCPAGGAMALRAVSLTAHMTSVRSRMSQRVSVTQLLTNHAVFSSWKQRGSQDFELHEAASVDIYHKTFWMHKKV